MDEERYRVECMPAVEHDSSAIFEHIFTSLDAAIQGKEAMADLLLYVQNKMSLMDDWSNLFWMGCSVNSGPWLEINEEEVPEGPSDDAKGLNYWRAMKCGEMPEYVPARINIKKQVLFGQEIYGPGAFECCFWRITRTLFVLFDGEESYLEPYEYDVLEWRKNEAEKNEGE